MTLADLSDEAIPVAVNDHAKITVGREGGTLEDMGSKNGTILNGEPHDPAALADGSLIVLGATGLKFRVFDAAASTDTISRKS